jgi:hypothetical protein
MIYRVTARRINEQPHVSIDWDNHTDAVESFVQLVKDSGGEINERAFKILLNILLGHNYRKDFYQIFGSDAVVNIEVVHT